MANLIRERNWQISAYAILEWSETASVTLGVKSQRDSVRHSTLTWINADNSNDNFSAVLSDQGPGSAHRVNRRWRFSLNSVRKHRDSRDSKSQENMSNPRQPRGQTSTNAVALQMQRSFIRRFSNACEYRDSADECMAILDAMSDLSARNIDGSTWAHIAAEHCRRDVLNKLFEAGVDADALDSSGKTILMKAAEQGSHGEVGSTVSRILKVKPMLETRDRQGRTALFYAVCHHFKYPEGSHTPLSILLKAGANINARDATGVTPLLHYVLWAISSNELNSGVIDRLLEYNADVKIRTRGGTSLLDLAMIQDDFYEVYRLMLACISFGLTPKPQVG